MITSQILSELKIEGPNSILNASTREFTFAHGKQVEELLEKTNAGLTIVPESYLFQTSKKVYFSPNPRLDFIKTCREFFPSPSPIISIDPSAQIHETVQLGQEGFGYERDIDGSLLHFPHYKGVKIEKDVVVKANTSIDRGVFEDTVISEGTKIDNLVHVAHNVFVGKNCLIVAGSIIGGSVHIGDNCFLGIGAKIRNKIKIGNDCFVAMGSVVVDDIPDGKRVKGVPAREF